MICSNTHLRLFSKFGHSPESQVRPPSFSKIILRMRILVSRRGEKKGKGEGEREKEEERERREWR